MVQIAVHSIPSMGAHCLHNHLHFLFALVSSSLYISAVPFRFNSIRQLTKNAACVTSMANLTYSTAQQLIQSPAHLLIAPLLISF